MIKDSFKTVFKFPLILAGFALPVLIFGLCYIPMAFGFLSNSANEYTPLVTAVLTYLLVFVAGLAIQFLLLPVLYNYTYEASLGSVEKGWFARGLKRNWWKMFIAGLISAVPFYIVYFIFFILVFAASFSFPEPSPTVFAAFGVIFAVFFFFWLGFLYTCYVSVAAEERFEMGFKNIFKVGSKNIIKVTLASFIGTLSVFALEGLLIWYYIQVFDCYSPDYLPEIISDQSSAVIATAIAGLILIAVSAVSMSFIVVYTNKLYIKRRHEVYGSSAPDIQLNAQTSEF